MEEGKEKSLKAGKSGQLKLGKREGRRKKGKEWWQQGEGDGEERLCVGTGKSAGLADA